MVIERMAVTFDPATWEIVAAERDFAEWHGAGGRDLAGSSLAELVAPLCRAELAVHLRIAETRGRHVFETEHLDERGKGRLMEAEIVIRVGEAAEYRLRERP